MGRQKGVMVDTRGKWCPNCRATQLVKRMYHWDCPCCGGELWGKVWFPGREGFEDSRRVTLMPDEWKGRGSKPRSSRSGRKRKKPTRRPRCWLDNY